MWFLVEKIVLVEVEVEYEDIVFMQIDVVFEIIKVVYVYLVIEGDENGFDGGKFV